MKTKEELRLYFENGDKPTQEHFWQWQDSYWHKDEKITNNDLSLIANDEFIYSNTDNTEVIGIGKKLIFPEGIKIIGNNSFSFGVGKSNITSVVFPDTLQKINSNAFQSQHLRGILRIPGSCKIIESYAFSSANIKITELILEEGLETIGNGAFQFSYNTNLLNIYIPDSVQLVGESSFNIPSLTTVSAPTGLDLSKAGIPATATITYR